jgi:hypothetical protein
MTDISDISARQCDSCGSPLPDGELYYHCRTELVAAKDSTIPDLKNPDKLIARALSEITGKDENELLNDVYEEIILQLCPTCRLILVKHIRGMLDKGCKGCKNCDPQVVKKKGKLLKFPPKKDK